jgi:hypothetical protein
MSPRGPIIARIVAAVVIVALSLELRLLHSPPAVWGPTAAVGLGAIAVVRYATRGQRRRDTRPRRERIVQLWTVRRLLGDLLIVAVAGVLMLYERDWLVGSLVLVGGLAGWYLLHRLIATGGHLTRRGASPARRADDRRASGVP